MAICLLVGPVSTGAEGAEDHDWTAVLRLPRDCRVAVDVQRSEGNRVIEGQLVMADLSGVTVLTDERLVGAGGGRIQRRVDRHDIAHLSAVQPSTRHNAGGLLVTAGVIAILLPVAVHGGSNENGASIVGFLAGVPLVVAGLAMLRHNHATMQVVYSRP
jgi:hypothetical protein